MTEYNKLSIKKWAVEDRPREKLMNKGVQNLSDAELLAILIGSGTKNITAVELSKNILSSAGNNLIQLGKLSFKELEQNKGIGKVRALVILAALELGRRRKYAEAVTKRKISASKDVFDLFQPVLSDLPHEEFWILLLNRSNYIIDTNRVSQGGLSGTVIDARIILKYAIEKLASGLVLCHNHPSGNENPSDADKIITKKMKEASLVMDINLLDHVIVAGNSYYSFSDDGAI